MDFKIQYLAHDEDSKFTGKGVTLSRLNAPRSLDEFNINVIDLSSHELWTCKSSHPEKLDITQDLIDLSRMIDGSSHTKILIILPQNVLYKYYWARNNDNHWTYLKTHPIKKLLQTIFGDIISDLAPIPDESLIYEKTTTTLFEITYPADFHFEHYFINGDNILTKSNISNKKTTVKLFDSYFTVLKISSYTELINFLTYIKLIELKDAIPDWVITMSLFDDEDQKEIVHCNEKTICECTKKINAANEKIKKNNIYKSILYTNGDELLKVVFEMLEKMLNCDLSNFKDERKEDFLITLDNITFIGEIKGVTSNIKNEHISQLEVHFQGYSDILIEQKRSEKVKAILIIDHQRSTILSDRQSVHINQVQLAERNNSLIIETITLLRLFEAFEKEEITSSAIIDMFSQNSGLLSYDKQTALTACTD